MPVFTIEFGTYIFPNQSFVVKGLPLDMDLDEAVVPRRQGTRIVASIIKGRRIKIRGKLHSADEGTVWADLDLMQRSLVKGEQSLRWREARELPAWFKRMTHDFIEGANPTVANVEIEMQSQSPFTRGLVPNSTTIQVITTSVTAVTIQYDGTAESCPVFILTAGLNPAAAGLEIKNVDRNETIIYNLAIPAGSSVTLDSDPMTALLDQVNAVANVEGAFPKLSPGQNIINLQGATYEFHMRYFDRFHD